MPIPINTLARPDRRNGTGNINEDFWLEMDGVRMPSALVAIKCKFSGTGSADFVISVDSSDGTPFDFTLLTVESAGGGGNDVNAGWEHESLSHVVLWPSRDGEGDPDKLNIAWTDPGTTTWGLEVLLASVDGA